MTNPYRFQEEDVERIDELKGRVLLANDMGTGKTYTSLLWARDNKTARPIIVVCPANVKFHWQHEAFIHLGMRAEVLYGRKRVKSQRRNLTKYPMIIVNYEILYAWLKYLKKLNPQLIIIDEVHRVKNPIARCSLAVKQLCLRRPYILALGGTPLENRPSELWNILNILCPKKKTFANYLRFSFRFSYAKKTRWGWVFKGAKNTKLLHSILSKVMIRRLKKDVLDQLPSKSRFIIPVEMSNSREYQLAEKDFRAWLLKNKPDKARKALRSKWKIEQRVQLGYLKRLAARLKLKPAMEWIDNFLEESDGKLVVFAIHRSIIAELHERYKSQSVTLTGSTGKEQRKLAVEQFVKSKKIRLFFGNVQAAGTGVNGLQHASDTSLTIELDYKPTTHNQADDRLHRIGQKNPVSNYYMIAKGTLEVPLCQMLQDKQGISDAILDGKEGKNKTSMDIFDQLCLALEKDKKTQTLF